MISFLRYTGGGRLVVISSSILLSSPVGIFLSKLRSTRSTRSNILATLLPVRAETVSTGAWSAPPSLSLVIRSISCGSATSSGARSHLLSSTTSALFLFPTSSARRESWWVGPLWPSIIKSAMSALSIDLMARNTPCLSTASSILDLLLIPAVSTRTYLLPSFS